MIQLRDAALRGEYPEVSARTVLSWFHKDPGTARRSLGEIIGSLGIDTWPKILECSIASNVVAACRKGFSVRNQMMHHIEKKNRSAADYLASANFSDAYQSVFRYYRFLRHCLHAY